MFHYYSVSQTVSIYANLYHVLYLFAGYVSHEEPECIGGNLGCATYLDNPSCGKSTGKFTATRQQGDIITISATVSASASAALNGIGISIGAENSGSHTVSTLNTLETTVGENDLTGLTGTICVRNEMTEFTLKQWKTEFSCRLVTGSYWMNPYYATHFRWAPTDVTTDHQVVTGHCIEEDLSPCTTKSPTPSPTTDEPTGSPTTKVRDHQVTIPITPLSQRIVL